MTEKEKKKKADLWDVWVSGVGELKIAESYRGRGKVATVVAPDNENVFIWHILVSFLECKKAKN